MTTKTKTPSFIDVNISDLADHRGVVEEYVPYPGAVLTCERQRDGSWICTSHDLPNDWETSDEEVRELLAAGLAEGWD